MLGKRIVVTGGSRGLGLGIVEALVTRGAKVTVVARDPARLAEVGRRLGVATVAGDITVQALARDVLGDVKPEVVILNAGTEPELATIDHQTWESFSKVWNTDVQAALHWIQAALALPLARGSRVLLGSSGAAIGGSPMSGGYAGAKRMLWMMASYANGLDRGIKFQAIVPQQMFADTELGRHGAEAYAARKGVSLEQFLAGFGKQLTARDYGEHVATILADAQYATPTVLGIKGDTGVRSLD